MGYKLMYNKFFSFLVLLVTLSIFPVMGFAQNYGTNDFVASLLTFAPNQYNNNGLTAFPILSLPFGGEDAAMGNAYTAVSREISFLNSNPAGSPLMGQTEFSIHHANIISDVMLETAAYTSRWDNIGVGAFAQILHSEFTALGISGNQIAASVYTESIIGLNFGYTFFAQLLFYRDRGWPQRQIGLPQYSGRIVPACHRLERHRPKRHRHPIRPRGIDSLQFPERLCCPRQEFLARFDDPKSWPRGARRCHAHHGYLGRRLPAISFLADFGGPNPTDQFIGHQLVRAIRLCDWNFRPICRLFLG